MLVFKEWLKRERKKKKLTQHELADWLNRQRKIDKPVKATTISHWESGYTEPSYTQFLYLCILAEVTDPMSAFLDESVYSLNRAGWDKLHGYTSDMAALLQQTQQYAMRKETGITRRLRLYDVPASAGTGQFLDDGQYTEVEVDETVPDSADFGIRVAGDSMTPRFAPGQIVWVHEQPTLENGEFGVFSLNGDAYIKKLGRAGGRPRLVSLNAKYPPIEVNEGDSLTVFGKVVG